MACNGWRNWGQAGAIVLTSADLRKEAHGAVTQMESNQRPGARCLVCCSGERVIMTSALEVSSPGVAEICACISVFALSRRL